MSVERDRKTEASEQFKKQCFSEAIRLYSEWLEDRPADVTPEQVASTLHNRALSHFRLQSWQLCIDDCTEAIKLHSTYCRAYYRRAAALVALSRFDAAIADYDVVHQMRPWDDAPIQKLRTTRLAKEQAAFYAAIARPEQTIRSEVNLVQLALGDHRAGRVNGPSWVYVPDPSSAAQVAADLPAVGAAPPAALIGEIHNHFATKGTALPIHTAYSLIFGAFDVFAPLSNIADVRVPAGEKLTIVGDVHGQYFDLVHTVRLAGFGALLDGDGTGEGDAPTGHLIVLGDMVDRGTWSTECVLLLCALKLVFPNRVHIIRGNHESPDQNMMFGFTNECRTSYTERVYQAFSEMFTVLPVGVRVNNRVLCIHGGLFSEPGVTLADISSYDRRAVMRRGANESSPLTDILWSDPDDSSYHATRKPSPRGLGTSFGYECARQWMASQGVTHIFRGHMQMAEGYMLHWPEKAHAHDCYFYTVFSAAGYCGGANRGGCAHVIFGADGAVVDTSFSTWTAQSVTPAQLPRRPESRKNDPLFNLVR